MTDFEVQAFLAIVEKKSVSKAADMIAITQSALSRRIDILEEELGYKLFERQRGGRNVTLTEEGQAFVSVAMAWQNLWREAQNIGSNRKAELSIASIDSLMDSVLPDVLADFMKQNPDVSITISANSQEMCCQYVEDKIADIAFVRDVKNYRSIKAFPAFTEPFVFICGKGSCYPKKINPTDLKPSDNIYYFHGKEADAWYERWFQSERDYAVRLNRISLLKPFMFTADKWAIVPSMNIKKTINLLECETREVEVLPDDRCIYYITNINNECKNKLVKKFLACLKKHLEKEEDIRSFMVL